MSKVFHVIDSQHQIDCAHLQKTTLGEEWLNYGVFVLENKLKNLKIAYFSNESWGKEYSTRLHALDPVRGLCKDMRGRFIVWNRLALVKDQQDFMNYRQQKCGIHQAITLNLSTKDELKLLTLGAPIDAPSLEKYAIKHMQKIIDLASLYTKLINNITTFS